MKHEITLEEEELFNAVKEYLERRGYNVSKVSIGTNRKYITYNHNLMAFSAVADVDIK